MQTLKLFLLESATVEKDITNWKSEKHSQLGSNEGGVHHDENGVKHYVKFYKNPQQARVEVAASKIHQQMGIKTLKPFLVRKNGKVGVATKWNDDLEVRKPRAFENLNHEQAHDIAKIHHAAVLTKNWDAVGLEHDNINFHKQTNHVYSVDHGGTFEFRAQGAHKPYGKDIDEIHSLTSGRNEASAHVFNHTFKTYPEAEKAGLDAVKKLRRTSVQNAFKSAGLADHKERADTFWTRRSLLLKHYKGK